MLKETKILYSKLTLAFPGRHLGQQSATISINFDSPKPVEAKHEIWLPLAQ